MSAFMTDLARACLPVAIVLLILTAVARGALWAQLDDARALRAAREYLAPLSTWCLIAVVTYLFAIAAAGTAGVLSVALALVMGAAAMLLRPAREREPAPVAAPPEPRPAPPAANTGTLWAGRGHEEPTREGRLWSGGA